MAYVAGLYMRLSKEDGRGESAGIEGQRLLLRAYAEKSGFTVAVFTTPPLTSRCLNSSSSNHVPM